MERNDPLCKPLFSNYFPKKHHATMESWDEQSAKDARRRVTGSYMKRPNTDKFNEHGRGNGLRYAVASMQGWRGELEDTHCAVVSLGQDRGIWRNVNLLDWSFFGVFDGHAGDTASSYCSDQLLGAIIYSPEFQEDIVKGLRAGFLRLDNRLKRLPEVGCGKDKGSSTAICVLISPFNIYIAHCGDSRAALSNRGFPVFATSDHKPSVTQERKRIEKAGGFITLTESLSGLITVSRAFGDFRYKRSDANSWDQIVTAQPDIHIQGRDKDDCFIILACNGVWDVMDTYEVVSYVSHLMLLTEDLEFLANSLINTCLYRGSKDSLTAVIVAFPGAPKPCDKIIFIDKNVDHCIENKIKELLYHHKCTDLAEVIDNLSRCEIPYLPAGAGLSAKLPLIETIYNELRPYRTQSALNVIEQKFQAAHLKEAIFFR